MSQLRTTPDEDAAGKRTEVFEYIAASIAAEEREAVTEALEKDRELVEKESDPLKFLRCENGSVEAAAGRLVSYWEERKKAFQERFLLPLVITGDGALDEASIEVMSTGLMVFLPDDAKGRSVLYLDYDVDLENSLYGMEKRAPRDKVRFYMLQRAAERGRPLVCLRYSQSSNMDKVKILAFQRFLSVFPVSLESLVIAFHAPPGATRVFAETVIPVMSQYLKNLPESTSVKPILGSTRQELFSELKKLNFVAKGLPEKVGGTWTWDTFQTWLKARRDIESMGSLKPPASLATASSANAAAASAPMPFGSVPAVTTAEDRIRQAEERKNRKRQKDLEYSRERRNREKDEYDDMQQKVEALQRIQAGLKDEESRLTSLLAEARNQVDIHLYGKPSGRNDGASSSRKPAATDGAAIPSSSERSYLNQGSAGDNGKKKSSAKERSRKNKSPRGSSSLRGSSSAPEERRDVAGEAPVLPSGDSASNSTSQGHSSFATMPSPPAVAARTGVSQDMFPLGSMQDERAHLGVSSLGMPFQSNEHLLSLLLQQQRSQQAQGYASQLHQLEQLRLQEQSRGLMLSQLGGVPNSFGVPVYLSLPPHLQRNDSRLVGQDGATSSAAAVSALAAQHFDRNNEGADLAALRSMLERRRGAGSTPLSSGPSATSTASASLGSQLQMLQLLSRQHQQNAYPVHVLQSLPPQLMQASLSYAAPGTSNVDEAQDIEALLMQRYRAS